MIRSNDSLGRGRYLRDDDQTAPIDREPLPSGQEADSEVGEDTTDDGDASDADSLVDSNENVQEMVIGRAV